MPPERPTTCAMRSPGRSACRRCRPHRLRVPRAGRCRPWTPWPPLTATSCVTKTTDVHRPHPGGVSCRLPNGEPAGAGVALPHLLSALPTPAEVLVQHLPQTVATTGRRRARRVDDEHRAAFGWTIGQVPAAEQPLVDVIER